MLSAPIPIPHQSIAHSTADRLNSACYGEDGWPGGLAEVRKPFLIYLLEGCLASNRSSWTYPSYFVGNSSLGQGKGDRILVFTAAIKILPLPAPETPNIHPQTIPAADLLASGGWLGAAIVYMRLPAICDSGPKVHSSSICLALLVQGFWCQIVRSATLSPE